MREKLNQNCWRDRQKTRRKSEVTKAETVEHFKKDTLVNKDKCCKQVS